MLKKKITNEEALSFARDLCLGQFVDVNNLIEGLHIERNRENRTCLITTDKQVAGHVLSELYGLQVSLTGDNSVRISVKYGEDSYAAITDYGEMLIDKEGFVSYLNNSAKDIECSLAIRNELYKNIVLTIIYVPEYDRIDSDNWRCMLLEADSLLVVLNAGHLLYTGESDFVKSLVLPYFSPNRLLFAIGNAQYIKSSEWQEAVARVKMQIGEDYGVFPFFTENISMERMSRYLWYERNMSNILSENTASSVKLRASHFADLDRYKMNLFESLLIQLKEEMERDVLYGGSEVMVAHGNKELIAKSKKHIEENLNLFLNTPLLASTRIAVEGFSKALKTSLKEDITASDDIKHDAGYLTRYLSAVWAQFLEEQNAILFEEFKREAFLLMDMMKLDLRSVTRNIKDVNVQENIKTKLENAFSVNTFFSRKMAAGNSLTDALTIGGIISGILISPVGFMAVVASEIIKVVNKNSINNEYKDELKTKVEDIIDKNKDEILQQAEQRFNVVAKDFHAEMMKCYEELLSMVDKLVRDEGERKQKALNMLEIINTLI